MPESLWVKYHSLFSLLLFVFKMTKRLKLSDDLKLKTVFKREIKHFINRKENKIKFKINFNTRKGLFFMICKQNKN